MGSSSQVNLGELRPWSQWGEFNAIQFAIRQALNKIQTATLVQIVSCSNDGGVSPIGTVDVLPLVNQVDGNGNAWPHTTVFSLPYARLVGGSNAVIMDPQFGDVGVAVFASRDISKVKSTLQQSNPGSNRKYNFGDGIYIGGCLQSTAPTQYVQFSSEGVTVVSPQAVTVTAPSISLGASGSTPQALMTDAFLNYWTETVYPFLVAKGLTGGPAPADSVTTAVEGA